MRKLTPNYFRVALWIVSFLVVSLTLVVYISSSASRGSTLSNNAPEAAPIYLWNLGTPTTLQQAGQSVSFPVKTPSYLPANTTLTAVRFLAGGDEVVLGYSTKGVQPMLNNSQGWTLAINMYPANSDPLVLTSSTYNPIVAVTSYRNGTVITNTESITGTVENWNTTTINGNVAMTKDLASNQPATVTWWFNGIFYQVAGNVPLEQVIEIAQSMGS